ELILDTRRLSPGEAADQVIALLDATFGFQSDDDGGDQNAAAPARRSACLSKSPCAPTVERR
ncbi:MAG: hypothetical protein RL093_1264, partial [Pseudomonadota bacterium]